MNSDSRSNNEEDIQYSKIETGSISNVTNSSINISNGDISNSNEIKLNNIRDPEIDLMRALREIILSMSDGVSKTLALTAVDGLQDELQKGDLIDEGTVQKWLNVLADAAPDAFEVAIRIITEGPVNGIHEILKKVAKRASELKVDDE